MGMWAPSPSAAVLGVVAVITKQEILLMLVGGLFVHGGPLRDFPSQFFQGDQGEKDISDGAACITILN
jgi:hypothetical protein